MKVLNRQIRDNIAGYNNLSLIHHSCSSDQYPDTLTFEEATDSNWPWWSKVACDMPYVCTSARRQAIGLYCLYCRANEEVAICRSEMANTVVYLKQQCEKCRLVIDQLSGRSDDDDEVDRFSLGAVCLLRLKVMKLESELAMANLAFKNIIEINDSVTDDETMQNDHISPSPSPIEYVFAGDDDGDNDDDDDDDDSNEDDCDVDSQDESDIAMSDALPQHD